MTLRPDIVLLVLDTHRVDRLSCYGYPLETSPHLDRLAADATLFRNAVSAAQWTVPSHASMFTGLYPSGHNLVQSYAVLSPELPTLAERLLEAGYFTAGFCNNPLVGVLNNGLRRGFQSFLNYSGFLSSRPNQAGADSNAFERFRQSFKRAVAGVMIAMQDTLNHSEDLLNFTFTLSPLLGPLLHTSKKFKGNTAKTLDDAARLLVDRKDVAEGQPIFAFINLMGTHLPYDPPQRFMERYAPHVQKDKAAQRYLSHLNSDVFGWMTPLVTSIDEQSKAVLDSMYDAEVASQDEQVGIFLEKLRLSGALDRTLVIICADHGEHLGEKQLMGHTFSIYNELMHVPLLIRDPNGDFPRGASVDHFVSTRRVFHTVLAAAGAANESEQCLTLAQAQNIASDLDHGMAFSEAVPPQNLLSALQRREPRVVQERRCDQRRRAVWEGEYKLIQVGDDCLELYNIFDDPQESKNLYDVLPDQARGMQEHLQTFVSHAGVAVPTTDYTVEYEDPLILAHLRNLGYLE